jgi:hypothetical protein
MLGDGELVVACPMLASRHRDTDVNVTINVTTNAKYTASVFCKIKAAAVDAMADGKNEKPN